MGSAPPPSPAFGQRLLPVVVDQIAREEPKRVLFYLPREHQPAKGYEEVTTSTYANAINRLCWWLESKIGKKPTTIGYVGQNDIRYLTIVMAAVKTGHKVLLSSPRNSVEGHLSLIEQSGCEHWITTPGVGKFDFIKLPKIPMLEVDELLNSKTVKAYKYEKTWEEGRNDTLAVLHTTGSTGLPRVIPLTLAHTGCGDALTTVNHIEGKLPTIIQWSGTKMLNCMPLFHVAGLSFSLCCTVFSGWSVVFPPPGPVMVNVLEETIDNIKLDSAFVSPLVLIDVVRAPKILMKLATLKFVTCAGGPVPPPVGNIINPKVPILQTMGMTEALIVPSVTTHPEEWAYYHFHPCSGFEMKPYAGELYEMIFVKKEELSPYQTIFKTFPELDVYETKDLYTRHPTIPYLYKYETRRDDLIVFSNGEKFNPVGVEFQLAHHPHLSGVYIAGRDRFQTAALLNPSKEKWTAPDEEIMGAVWPVIEQLNKTIPAFAQIERNFVKILREPFPRTPKGTVARYEVEKVFAKDIAEIYKDKAKPETASSEPTSGALEIDVTSEESVRKGLRKAIELASPGVEIDEIKDDDSLLAHGVDSLHVIRLSKLLGSAFPSSPIQVDVGTIYANPSLTKLGAAVWAILQDSAKPKFKTEDSEIIRTEAVADSIAKHLPSFLAPRTAREHVVLTGSTGAIGSYLLDALVKNERVAKIWCLNRSNMVDAAVKQGQLAKSRGLSANWKGKVRFVQIDLASHELGMSYSEVKEIKEQGTIFIHNAWEVNFQLPLSSFDTQLDGLKSMVRICTDTRHKIRFFFVSSISAATNWPTPLLGPVPETKLNSLNSSVNGYGASKLVAEHLLSRAAEAGVLHLSVLRVGQVGGPVKFHGPESIWTRRDWVPAIIDASAYLRKLPADLGAVSALDWIPIDLLAEIMGQLIDSDAKRTSAGQGGEAFYNLVNPKTVSWQALLPTVKARLNSASSVWKNVQVVPFTQWLNDLEKAEGFIVKNTEITNGSTPLQTAASRAQTGLKLLPFFRLLAKASPVKDEGLTGANPFWAVDNGLARSSTFAELTNVSSEWFETWLKQWGY